MGNSRRFDYQDSGTVSAGFMTSTPQTKSQAVFSPPKFCQVSQTKLFRNRLPHPSLSLIFLPPPRHVQNAGGSPRRDVTLLSFSLHTPHTQMICGICWPQRMSKEALYPKTGQRDASTKIKHQKEMIWGYLQESQGHYCKKCSFSNSETWKKD